MMQNYLARFSCFFVLPATLLILVNTAPAVKAQKQLYNPITLPTNGEVSDSLSDKDIPMGQGGFARDYSIELNAGDNIAIDLSSDSFDTIVTLMKGGVTVVENDDGPDGTTNSLLFTRIKDSGTYIVRVRAFGETAGGPFKLKVTRLKPI
ncbi:PPC domain-containing protein [Phormidium sp. LEGE 05292]|uniref:PPC domain-containing protein n=1 Tax=[Phormidium] sp. LEGE 05292 TaxID=767427 RepID=UPI001880A5B6|nr:PPC domain-containing protein [Phormidium sp. LEGE 05292]MBE9229300.1 PPC domain-containing protein [Phormidium sp. LEGE 05292]